MRTPLSAIIAGAIALAPGLLGGFAACGSSTPASSVDALVPQGDAPTPQDTLSPRDAGDALDTALDAPTTPADLSAPADTVSSPDAGSYRSSLAVCWTDATCKRVMAVAHGGAWDLAQKPYDSNAAIAAAYAIGVEGVKIDVRVTKDNVPVIAHSSPIEIYESLDCYNKKIEDMTATQVVKCHRFPSLTETFQRLDDVLNYLRNKMVTQLCVKRSVDYARTIAEIQLQKAEDFAFIELGSTGDLQNIVPTLPGASSAWFMVNVASNVTEVDTILNTIKNPRAFMVEFDPNIAVATITSTNLHPANVRSFTYDSSLTASVAQIKALFDGGFDVVSAQTAGNAVKARILVNQARGISPP